MRRGTPRIYLRKHVVMQHEVPCVRPVVRNLAVIYIAHYVGRSGGKYALRFRNKSVHQAAIYIGNRARRAVRAADIAVASFVVWLCATAVKRVRRADRRHAVSVHGDAVSPGEGAEVFIKGAILLHDNNDMLYLMDAGINSTRDSKVKPMLKRGIARCVLAFDILYVSATIDNRHSHTVSGAACRGKRSLGAESYSRCHSVSTD